MTAANTAGVLEAKTNVRAGASSTIGSARVAHVQARRQHARRQHAVEEVRMIARIAGTMLLSVIVFVIVSLLVSLGVLWLTGGVVRGAVIGVVCGFAAAFVVATVSNIVGRGEDQARGRVSDRNERSNDRADRPPS